MHAGYGKHYKGRKPMKSLSGSVPTGSALMKLLAIFSRPVVKFDELIDRYQLRIIERAYHYRLIESKNHIDKLCAWILEQFILEDLL